MYRIVFVAKRGKWVIKIAHTFGLFWNTVCGEDKKALTFENYAAAKEKVDTLGLGQVYKDYRGSRVGQIMQGTSEQEYYRETPIGTRLRQDMDFQRSQRHPHDHHGHNGHDHLGHDNLPHSTLRHERHDSVPAH